jgi:hypothetical protein
MSSQETTDTNASWQKLAISLFAATGLAGCAAQANHYQASHYQTGYFEEETVSRASIARRQAIPLPPAQLLARSAPPSCEADARGLAAAIDDDRAKQSQLANRLRLEFERDCYKAAEAKTRQRLARLQAAARATSDSVRKGRNTR